MKEKQDEVSRLTNRPPLALETPEILSFIIGEVKRQGYDVENPKGAQRIVWMADAWDYACNLFRWGGAQGRSQAPPLEFVKVMGMMIEPEKNGYYDPLSETGGWRKMPVTVRGEPLLPPAHIPRALEKLWERQDQLTPDEFYYEFELIHPFVDGNGRTGKIIHNWMNSTLHKPVLVKDFFGHGVP